MTFLLDLIIDFYGNSCTQLKCHLVAMRGRRSFYMGDNETFFAFLCHDLCKMISWRKSALSLP